MKKKLAGDGNAALNQKALRENTWCEKYGQFIDLDACYARSLNRPVCRRCYKNLIQLTLPFEKS